MRAMGVSRSMTVTVCPLRTALRCALRCAFSSAMRTFLMRSVMVMSGHPVKSTAVHVAGGAVPRSVPRPPLVGIEVALLVLLPTAAGARVVAARTAAGRRGKVDDGGVIERVLEGNPGRVGGLQDGADL